MKKLILTIEILALPPVEFSPNWRGFWAKRYKAGWHYKADVFYNAQDAKNRASREAVDRLPLPYAEMSLVFVVAEQRIRDEDNMRCRFKPGQDALVDAGIIADDDMEHLVCKSIKFEVDKTRAPMTIIEIAEILQRRP